MSEKKNNKGLNSIKTQMPKFNIFWIYGAIAVLLIAWSLFGGNSIPQEVSWSQIDSMIVRGDVEEIYIVKNKEVAEVQLKKDVIEKYAERYKNLPTSGAQFTSNILGVEVFNDNMLSIEKRTGQIVPVKSGDREGIWDFIFGPIGMLLIMVILWFVFMKLMSKGNGGGNGGVFSVGKAKAQLFDKENSTNISFKNVAGLEEAKVEIMEIVDFLKRPEKYKELGGKIPKGALLVGPPGTGKTLLAKAVAGEANVPFFSISGSDFVEMFVGVGASRVRDLFKQAKDKAPCIVFIDEIDAIGRARGKNAGFSSNDERENTLNQLLTEMDGFGTNAGVIILAATNRADILDKALLRAGRFDRQIEVGLPDLIERKEIFDVHLLKLKLAEGLDIEFLAKQTPGFSGADIANVCNEAALIAARHDKTAVEREDFLSAVDRIVGGLERKNKIITTEEKRVIAYHESGHATVSWILENANPLIKVTIIPRGKALGAAWYLPEERQITTREQMMDEMASILGGRVAEQFMFGQISTGALNDLERVTKMAYAMVAYYGMSAKVGSLSYYDSSSQGDMNFTKPYSELTAQCIDSETRAVIDEAYAMAKNVLEDKREGLVQLAELLLEKEVVFTDDLVNIFGKRAKDVKRELEEAKVAELKLAEQIKEDASAVNEVNEKSIVDTENTAEPKVEIEPSIEDIKSEGKE